MKKLITLITIVCIVGAGCTATLSEKLTPANLPQQAKDYVVANGGDANDWGGYQSLEKLNKLSEAVTTTYTVTMHKLKQLAETNELNYSLASGTVSSSLELARAREQSLFGPDGLLTLGLGLLGVGGLGTIAGKLLMKRPQDWEPEEVEEAMTELNIQLSAKEKQFVQTVTGLENFFKKYKNGDKDEKIDTIIKEIKDFLKDAQDLDTKMAVGATKANV